MNVRDVAVLRDPILVAAFGGWGDASSVATTSAAFLLQSKEARTLADFDTEELFVLTETRPHVRLKDGTQRRIQWPSVSLVTAEWNGRDAVALLGPEPQLRWRSFARQVATFWREHGRGGPAIVLGAFLAGVSHAAPTVLTGFATTQAYREKLEEMGIHPSGYEGPTGIHSALMEAFEAEGIGAVSIWAAAPHYLGAMPNPKACADQLTAVDRFFDLGLDLAEMREAGAAFEKQVGLALASGKTDVKREEPPPGPLPSAAELVEGVEEFLRQNKSS